MKPELDTLLCEKYPKIFADRHKPITHTAMCWGFECGDGWFTILDCLCGIIQSHIDNVTKYQYGVLTHCPQVIANQVKEKYGGLRFYYHGGDDEIAGMVRMAEHMALRTCEECGKPGKTREGGWIRTLCDEHTKE